MADPVFRRQLDEIADQMNQILTEAHDGLKGDLSPTRSAFSRRRPRIGSARWWRAPARSSTASSRPPGRAPKSAPQDAIDALFDQEVEIASVTLRLNSESLPTVAEGRSYPSRPYLAVSAAIIRDGQVLIVRRARPPASASSPCRAAASRRARPCARRSSARCWRRPRSRSSRSALAGYREAIARDADGQVERHFVILPFAARWLAGEVALNEELAEARWLCRPSSTGSKTTEGLAEMVRAACAIAGCRRR